MTEPGSGDEGQTAERRLVVVSAGISQPSSSRLLANRLAAATEARLREADIRPATQVIEVRDHAADLVNNILTSFPSERLAAAIDTVARADGLIAVSPIFSASYSGLFKLFFDVLERGRLAGMPVLVAATGGSTRHSLALDHAFRPLFAYLAAAVVPTGVFAAAEDWGRGDSPEEPDLAVRIEEAGLELADAMALRPPRLVTDDLAAPEGFGELIRATDQGRGDSGR
jgi:FMN reductase